MASAWRSFSGFRRLAVWMAFAVVSGCATPQIVSGPTGEGPLPALAIQAPVGLPADKTAYITSRLTNSLQQQNVSLAASGSAPARYTVQGFCSATSGGGSTAFVCVWDVNESSGVRAQRIVTEEQVAGQAQDPYALIGTATLDQVADTVAARLVRWLPTAPEAGAQLFSLPQLFGSERAPPVVITGISGAPGDGNQALTTAMAGALRAQNIPVGSGGSRAYRLGGRVAMSNAGGGDQTVVIEWELTDPSGTSLGVITQRNRVPRGALDGRWGETAEDAANAAANGVIQLLPQRG